MIFPGGYITIMVAFKNISAYDATTLDAHGRAKISGGPLYSLDEIKVKGNKIHLATPKCIKDARNLGFDDDGVSKLLSQLSPRDYKYSEWCCCGTSGIHYAACDAYVLKRHEYNETTFSTNEIEYFLKFALKKNGDLVIVVSCHLSL